MVPIQKELHILRKMNIQEENPPFLFSLTHLKMIIQACFLSLDNMKHCFINWDTEKIAMQETGHVKCNHALNLNT